MQSAAREPAKRFCAGAVALHQGALSNIISDDEVERLFVETEQYSARVVDIGGLGASSFAVDQEGVQ